ncbi:MAG: hypothetical protein DWQ04_01445 [Chloroflexi bacterium]|nr:MAG: hypothetical protein DWQ04_01445 [Chloroflexota bacterium]
MPELGEPLSGREIDVLNCMVKGASNKEIALELSISPNTVKVHLRNIYTKLGAQSRTEATRIAFENGLASVPRQPAEPETAVESEDDIEEAGETAVSPTSPTTTPIDAPTSNSTSPAPKQRINWQIIALGLFLFLSILVIGIISLNLSNNNTSPTATIPPTPYTETDLGNNWSESAPLSTPTTNMATIAIGLQVYLIGGETESGVINAVQIYDTVTRLWSAGENKPTAVSDTTAAALFGEIYIPGGRLDKGTVTNVVEVFSPANNAWRTVASLPKPTAGGLLISDGSFLYLFGGTDGTNTFNTAYQYDFESNSWNDIPEMSQSRAYATGGEINGLLYIVGGEGKGGALSTCEQFNPAEETWAACPDMQQARSHAGGTTLVNKLYVLGGTAVSDSQTIISELYNPETNEWEKLSTPLADNSHWTSPGITRVETKIYAIGGQLNGEISQRNLIYAPLAYRTYLPAASGGE